MITAIDNVDELNKIIRFELIKQSELPSERVLNSVSAYGPDMDKLLSNAVYDSVIPSDTVLLFELTPRESNDSTVSYMYEGKIQFNKAYRINVIIYGDASGNVINKLVARFRTEKVRQNLQQQGVFLESISDGSGINEFKNERMWIRNDTEIDIICRMEFDEIEPSNTYLDVNGLKIIYKR